MESLSEFYLDTELQELDFNYISSLLIASNYPLEELKKFDRYEVFPLLHSNLLSVAGEWAEFDEEWLYARCERFYQKRFSVRHRILYLLLNVFLYKMRKAYWTEIEKRIKLS